jgi:hypothetical protein
MPVRYRNAAHNRSNDADEALIGAAQEEVLEVRGAV